MAIVNDSQMAESLQADINTMIRWSDLWLMNLNYSKCKVMHFGNQNIKYDYVMHDKRSDIIAINPSECEKDLGVYISNDLKWNKHVTYICSKANSAIGMLRRTFRYFDIDMVKTLYKSLIRSNLDYAASVWSPHYSQDITMLEQTQRRATRLSKQLRCEAYENRLKTLGLSSLELRRKRGDIIQLFKIVKGIDNVKFYNPKFVEQLNQNQNNHHTNRCTRSHNQKTYIELVKNYSPRYNFFTNRASRLWNTLTQAQINSISVNQFKSSISGQYD